MDKVEIDTIFPKYNTATTRGHTYKIYKRHCGTNRRKYSFSQRVIAHWNGLSESVIDATSVNSFKNRLNNHWTNIVIKFVPDFYSFKDRLNNHWKNIVIKFVPDFYGPQAGISRNDNVMDLRGQS